MSIKVERRPVLQGKECQRLPVNNQKLRKKYRTAVLTDI